MKPGRLQNALKSFGWAPKCFKTPQPTIRLFFALFALVDFNWFEAEKFLFAKERSYLVAGNIPRALFTQNQKHLSISNFVFGFRSHLERGIQKVEG